jgi:hypothetical protein
MLNLDGVRHTFGGIGRKMKMSRCVSFENNGKSAFQISNKTKSASTESVKSCSRLPQQYLPVRYGKGRHLCERYEANNKR